LGKGKWHAEQELKNREAVKKVLVDAEDGITKTELSARTKLSRPTVDRHLEDIVRKGNLRTEGRLLFWVTNYEQKKRISEVFDALLLLDRQRKLSHQGNYEIVDVGPDSVLRDRRTGEKVFTVHMRIPPEPPPEKPPPQERR
jgi:DNA-binding transcriptional ArsR family regulator